MHKLGFSSEELDTVEPSEQLPTSAAIEDSDFLDVKYRALSAAILDDRPIDFSNVAVLKRSMKKLNSQTVYKDHETSVDNWVGTVSGTEWDKGNDEIPPGINANLKIDIVKDPMLARGIMQGAIHSASVTVSFEWKPSHPKLMEDNSFFNRLGETVDDEMVRIVVTDIEKYWEISLVWQGADQYAKRVENQSTKNPSDHRELDIKNSEQKETIAEFSRETEILQFNKETSMDKILKSINETLKTEFTEENFESSFSSYLATSESTHQEALSKLKEEFSKLEGSFKEEIASLKSKLEAQKIDVENGRRYLEDERKEAIRLYKISKGEPAINDLIIKTLEKADLDVAQAWKASFQDDVEAKFPSRCKKCNSQEISKQSSEILKEEIPVQEVVINSEHLKSLKDLHS